jgi:hypothetical protein
VQSFLDRTKHRTATQLAAAETGGCGDASESVIDFLTEAGHVLDFFLGGQRVRSGFL